MELLRRAVTLELEDNKRHLNLTFQFPEGAAALEVIWTFAPWQVGSLKNHVTLSLHGPSGFRGAGHRHGQEHHVVLTETQATPGYLPGPLEAGLWTVKLHTHAVLCSVQGELQVRIPDEVFTFTPEHSARVTLPAHSGGWMQGDLHCHSTHSDARWTPAELARAAVERGLTFLSLTDHNTTAGRTELARAFPGLLLPGTELTTFHGHAVVLGRDEYTDWTALEPQHGMRAMLDDLSSTAAYLTMAHPFAPGDPICTGCGWTYFDLRPENATHMEVWNGPWTGRHNERALDYWYRLLAAGHRVIATVGTDAHGLSYHPEHGFTCTPTTSSDAQLLAQLKGGETYLSREALFDLQVKVQGQRVPLGSQAPAGTWELNLTWHNLPVGSVLTIICDGERLTEPLTRKGQVHRSLTVEQWLNLEVRLTDGSLFMVSNPVFVSGAM